MEKIICIFGASSTWGAWDPEQGGWANRLRLALESSHKEELWVYNMGVSGDTTTDILKRFDVEAEARKPDILIFSAGKMTQSTFPRKVKIWSRFSSLNTI